MPDHPSLFFDHSRHTPTGINLAPKEDPTP